MRRDLRLRCRTCGWSWDGLELPCPQATAVALFQRMTCASCGAPPTEIVTVDDLVALPGAFGPMLYAASPDRRRTLAA